MFYAKQVEAIGLLLGKSKAATIKRGSQEASQQVILSYYLRKNCNGERPQKKIRHQGRITVAHLSLLLCGTVSIFLYISSYKHSLLSSMTI